MERVESLIESIESQRIRLLNHVVYQSIHGIEQLRRFSETHVFAVWDFMSLLKSLQRELTCTSIPWRPVGDPDTRFLINEIVVGEESDVDSEGNRISHFELYLQAMREMGASTDKIESLLEKLAEGRDIEDAISDIDIDSRVKDFLSFTFEIAVNAPVHVKAAVFTFGREDIIPEMFLKIIDELPSDVDEDCSTETFRYYIERHIEIDGGHHKQLAHQMVEKLCRADLSKWREAEIAASISIEKRIALWDSVVDSFSMRANA